MAHLGILQPDARSEARLSDALAGHHEVAVLSSWAKLMAYAEEHPLDGCVVDADSPDRTTAVEHIARLLKRNPDMAMVAYADVHETDPELVRLGALGVHGVLLARRPPWASGIRRAVGRALAASRAGQVARRLDPSCPPDARLAVAWAVEHAAVQPTVSDFAAALGYTPHRLTNVLVRAELPSPGRLLLWGRLLLGASLLDTDGRTVEDTALTLGYSTASGLSRAMTKETGMSPGEVARSGGLPFMQKLLFRRPRRRARATGIPPLLVACLLSVATSACATSSGGGPMPPTPGLDQIFDRPPVDQTTFGVLAVDAATGKTIYARHPARKLIPASNQKILVTAAALSLLGPDYRYKTGLWGTGPVVDGTLRGDLVLVATGDPTLSSRYWSSGETALATLADSLHAAGVRQVAGGLVVDVSAWDSTTVGPTWEVEDLRFRYAATGGAFTIDEGEVHVVVRGGDREGAPATVSWTPKGDDDFLATHVVTAHPDSSTRVRADYLPESRRLVLEGRVGALAEDTLAFAVRDPVRQAAAALNRALHARGITVAAGSWVAWDDSVALQGACHTGAVTSCAQARSLGSLWSPPLTEIIAGILKPSQNWMTEQLLRTLGAEFGPRGGWPEGIEVVTRFLVDEVGVDSMDVSVRDGSGLSFYNVVTPRALVRVLTHMANGPNAQAFRLAMAEPGEEGSTLEERLPEMSGRLFAKTGTISNVNSLSGYLVGKDGREVVFSILSNGSGLPASRVRAAVDDAIKALAAWHP